MLQGNTSMVRTNIATPSTTIAKIKEDVPYHQPQRDEVCTAELLLEEWGERENTTAQIRTRNKSSAIIKNQWQFFNDTGEWRWMISDRGKRACGGLSFVTPLQSTPRDIYKALQNKWLLMIGDSSVRMLHDYLVGRWLGGYTHWPSQLTNHGPPEHTVPCRDPHDKMRKGIPYAPPECTYDVFWGGARVTFLWLGLDLSPEALPKLLHSTVGSPDLVVAQHGYWEQSSGRDPSIMAQKAPQTITAMLDHLEMESLYTHAYTKSPQKRVWMSLFDSVYGPHDGSNEANDLGWEIFDRTKLTTFDGKRVGAHPMHEVLELELELLLVLIHETQSRNEAMYRIGG